MRLLYMTTYDPYIAETHQIAYSVFTNFFVPERHCPPLRHSSTQQCLRKVFVDAVDRGHTTYAILQADHAALNY